MRIKEGIRDSGVDETTRFKTLDRRASGSGQSAFGTVHIAERRIYRSSRNRTRNNSAHGSQLA